MPAPFLTWALGAWALAWGPAPTAESHAPPPALLQTADTLIPLQGATRLELAIPGGSVVLEGWDRNEIRLRAEHGGRTTLAVRRRGEVIAVEAEGVRGPPLSVDLRISVPRSLHVRAQGMLTDVEARDLGGDLSVETVNGAILLEEVSGRVRATSVNGVIRARNSSGRLELQSVARGIEVVDPRGEVLLESVSGPILIRGSRAPVVEAGTMSGRIVFEGALPPGGRLDLGSHSGRIVLILPRAASATVTTSTLSGRVESAFAGNLADDPRRRRRTFTLGGGDARVEVETFSGSIHLVEAGSETAALELERGAIPDPVRRRSPPPPAPPGPPVRPGPPMPPGAGTEG